MIRCSHRPFAALLAAALFSCLATAPAQRGPVPGLDASSPYLIYYGNWDGVKVDFARLNYRMVILHPLSNITPAAVAAIKAGPDAAPGTTDDVIVLAYISVGEDARPGAPVAADGNGPRIDPRSSDNDPLSGVTPLGLASPGGTGYASYYLDDADHDGQPDRNSIFGGYYVNPGDPAWFTALKTMTLAGDGHAGMDELLTATTGLGFACDGLFLDTLDTPAPNSFGATRYEWTAPAYRSLVQSISTAYPGKLLLGNRGLFFYNPNLKTYAFTLRPYLNMVMFESYYTDSSNSGLPSAYFEDNKFNFAPKINAEAGRPDGFTVLCLGYDHSPPLPPATIEQDYVESQGVQGWMLYRTNPALDAPFQTGSADWSAAHPDTAPPEWDSTAATGPDSDPLTPGNQAPDPRVGIQQAMAGGLGQATVRWDVARDQTGPVRYNIYYTSEAVLNFATATKLTHVSPALPALYAAGTGSGRFACEYTITGLEAGATYRFAVRAEDALGHEDTNTVVLAATTQTVPSCYAAIAIDGAFADWADVPVLESDPAESTPVDFGDIAVANDDQFLYIRFTVHTAAEPFSGWTTHLFIDTDNNGATGFVPSGTTLGSEFMVEGSSGYDERAGGFNNGGTTGVSWSRSPAGANATQFEVRLSRNARFSSDNSLVFQHNTIRLYLQDNGGDTTLGSGIVYSFASAPPAPSHFAPVAIDGSFLDWEGLGAAATHASDASAFDVSQVWAANDDDFLYLRFTLHAAALPFSSTDTHLFLDTDNNAATGFVPSGLPAGTFGSEMMVEWGSGYDQRDGSFNAGNVSGLQWSMNPTSSGTQFEIRLARGARFANDNALVFGGNSIRVLLQDNRGSGLVVFACTLAADPPGTFATMAIDGDFSDWASVPVRALRGASGTAMDFASVQAANNNTHIFVRLLLHAPPPAGPFTDWQTNLFLDTDNSAGTGFHPSGTAFGSECLVQSGFGYDERGGGFNEGGVSGLDWQIAGSGTSWEFRMARAARFADGASVFTSGTLRFLFQDDRGPVLFHAPGIPYGLAGDPAPTAFRTWASGHFSTFELTDPAVSGASADPDHDGRTNLLEFALNGDPRNADPGAGFAGGLHGAGSSTHLSLTYTKRPAADGVTYTPEASYDLATWDATASLFVTLPPVDLGAGFQEVTVRLAAPVGAGHPFLRLRAQATP